VFRRIDIAPLHEVDVIAVNSASGPSDECFPGADAGTVVIYDATGSRKPNTM
jgi:hypothetical protein